MFIYMFIWYPLFLCLIVCFKIYSLLIACLYWLMLPEPMNCGILEAIRLLVALVMSTRGNTELMFNFSCSPNRQPCELRSAEDCGVWYWCTDQAVKWRHPVLRASGHPWDKPSHQSPLKSLHPQSTEHAQGSVQSKEAWAEIIAAALNAHTSRDSKKHTEKRQKTGARYLCVYY